MDVDGTDHGSRLDYGTVPLIAPLSPSPCAKRIYKLVKVSPDGSIQAIESEEEIRAVEAVLRDHEAYNSDEYSEPDAKKLPMDRRSLLIQLQVYDTLLSQITIRQHELNRGSHGQFNTNSTDMEVAIEVGKHGTTDRQGRRGSRKGAEGTERLVTGSQGADVGQESYPREAGRGWDGHEDDVEIVEEVRRGSGGNRSTKRRQRQNLRHKEVHSRKSESGSPAGEGWEREGGHRAKRREEGIEGGWGEVRK